MHFIREEKTFDSKWKRARILPEGYWMRKEIMELGKASADFPLKQINE